MFLDNGNILNLHSWEAPIVRSTRGINEAIKARGIANKKLRAVRPLGLAWQLHQHNKYHILKRALTRQRHLKRGITFPEYLQGVDLQIEQIQVPCKVTLYEPLVLIFDDDTTWEMWLTEDGGLKMSFGHTDPNDCRGINECNFDADALFGCLAQTSVKWGYLYRDEIGARLATRTVFSFELWFDGEYGLALRSDRPNICTLELGYYDDGRYAPATMPFCDFASAGTGIKQLPVYYWTGDFMIIPIKWGPKDDRAVLHEDHLYDKVLSMDGDQAYGFVLYFLKKYFDEDLPHYTAVDDPLVPGEWNETFNHVVSYKTMTQILRDMKRTAQLLEEDYDSPQLDEIKMWFLPHCADCLVQYQEIPREESLWENRFVFADFYRRFCYLVEHIMNQTPQCRYFDVIPPL